LAPPERAAWSVLEDNKEQVAASPANMPAAPIREWNFIIEGFPLWAFLQWHIKSQFHCNLTDQDPVKLPFIYNNINKMNN
jgi:hypothetical protein